MDTVNVRRLCPGLATYPFLPAGLIIMVLLLIAPLCIFYIRYWKTACSRNGVKIPSISKTWRDPYTYSIAVCAWTILLVVYNICLVDAWLICIWDLFVFILAVVFIVNTDDRTSSEGKKVAAAHLFFAFLVFTALAVLCALIVADYISWNGWSITMLVILELSYLVVLIGHAAQSILHEENRVRRFLVRDTEDENDWEWHWSIALAEHLLGYFTTFVLISWSGVTLV